MAMRAVTHVAGVGVFHDEVHQLITAIGVSILLQTLAMMIWGRNPLPFPQVLPGEPLHLFGALITPTQILLLSLATAAMLALAMLGVRLLRLLRIWAVRFF